MKRYTWLEKAKFLTSVLFLAGVTHLSLGVSSSQSGRDATASRAESTPVPARSCCKIHADQAKGATCVPPSAAEGPERAFALPGTTEDGTGPLFRRVTVSSLVQRALEDQRVMLRTKASELKRWNTNDQAAFAKWFGVSSEEARQQIHQRVLRVLEVNKNYSVGNFRRARHRAGVYAYVYADKPGQIYVDDKFITQRPSGEDSRAGTITHEMSHFLIVSGTKDHAYGTADCKTLARQSPSLAMNNADNFEFWAEGAR